MKKPNWFLIVSSRSVTRRCGYGFIQRSQKNAMIMRRRPWPSAKLKALLPELSGRLGSDDIKDYTAIGDVKRAARLQA
jgi:hypothetical protein